MIRFKSILSRVVILHVIAVAITSVLMSLALSWLLQLAADNIHNEAMAKQAVAIARHLVPQPDCSLSLELTQELQGLYSQPYGRYSYAVVDAQGAALFSSMADRGPIFPVGPSEPEIRFFDRRNGDATISGASIRRTIGSKTVWVQAAEDLANRDVLTDDIVSEFFGKVGWITLPILALMLLADIVIFRRALMPLRQASQIARQIGPARTDIRLPADRIPNEVRPLVLAVNQALDRLENGFRVQREFTADAAHELRTPLSILRTRLDTLDDRQIARTFDHDIESMTRVVGQLLDIAELDAFEVEPWERADLHGACGEIAAFLAPLALKEGKEIAMLGSNGPVWVKGNAEMIKRAIRNLGENAIKHTPANTTVEFVVTEQGLVSVRDSGPGIADDDRAMIFRRFWRRNRNEPGNTGLGLPIVQRIAELHGATVTVENRPSGGAEFSVQFCPAEAAGSR